MKTAGETLNRLLNALKQNRCALPHDTNDQALILCLGAFHQIPEVVFV